MKKLAALFVLIIVVLLSCTGQTSCSDPEKMLSSVFLGNNPRVITYSPVHIEMKHELIGQWITDDIDKNSRSRIKFKANGSFSENIYSLLDHQLITSIAGSYEISGNNLRIFLDSGQVYNFGFEFVDNNISFSMIE